MPAIVVGGLVLAAVTSLPNAVAAVYLAARGRGAAMLSTTLNSNTLNVALGLVLPSTVVGLGRPSGQATLITAWYIGLTAVTLAFVAYRDRGIRRYTGILIIAAYVVFAGCVLDHRARDGLDCRDIVASAVVAAACGIRLVTGCHPGSVDSGEGAGSLLPPRPSGCGPGLGQLGRDAQRSDGSLGRGTSPVPETSRPLTARKAVLVPGWPVRKLCFLGLELSVCVAVVDAALGHRVILIGLLIAGPCCVLLTGRWIPTGLTGLSG